MAKRAIDQGVELDVESGLALEWDCYEQLLDTKDRVEGLAAFAERRKPLYKGEWKDCNSPKISINLSFITKTEIKYSNYISNSSWFIS